MKTSAPWKQWQTPETKQVEAALKASGFKKASAYRYNSASIRLRIIDPRFDGKSHSKRFALAEQVIGQLPADLQSEILFLALLTPDEAKDSSMNEEFENPSPILH